MLEHAAFLADSALRPDFLRSFATRLSEDYPFSVGILGYRPDGTPSGRAAFVGGVEGTEDVYFRHFAAVNPYPEIVRRHRLENRTVVFSDWYPVSEWHRTEYFNDFVRKNGGDYFLALSISLKRAGRTSITITRSDAAGGDFGAEDVRRLDGLRPFVRNAVLLRSLFEEANRARLPGPESLDRPTVLLRGGSRPRPLNGAADELFRRKGGRGVAGAATARGAFRCDARDFPGLGGGCGLLGATVAVLPGDSSSSPVDEESLLRHAFELTPAQARVACDLLAGLSGPEIAAYRGVSSNTVSTHVKAIHQKIGIRSSRQLFGVLERLRRSARSR